MATKKKSQAPKTKKVVKATKVAKRPVAKPPVIVAPVEPIEPAAIPEPPPMSEPVPVAEPGQETDSYYGKVLSAIPARRHFSDRLYRIGRGYRVTSGSPIDGEIEMEWPAQP